MMPVIILDLFGGDWNFVIRSGLIRPSMTSNPILQQFIIKHDLNRLEFIYKTIADVDLSVVLKHYIQTDGLPVFNACH